MTGAADRAFRGGTIAASLVVLALPAFMGVAMLFAARAALARFGLSFVLSSSWNPVEEQFGALPFLFGTLVSSVLALVIAVPLSLGVAIFLAELSPDWLKKPVGYLIELLAAVPSVIYGLWGLAVIVPLMRTHVGPFLVRHFAELPLVGALFKGPSYGIGMLTASTVLALMVVPIVTSLAREALNAVPRSQREAALALGATRWEVTRLAVLPAAWSGLVGAVTLGFGRALGETMAVTMLIGNRPEVASSLLAPGSTLASVIANEFSEATTDFYVSALVALAFVLFVMTVGVHLAARAIATRVLPRIPGGQLQ